MATIHVKTAFNTLTFQAQEMETPAACIARALLLASSQLGSPVKVHSVCGTNSNEPLSNLEQRIRIPEGGITITTTTPASIFEMFTNFSEKLSSMSADMKSMQGTLTWVTARFARQTVGRILSISVGSADLHRPAGSTDYWQVKDDPRVATLAAELGLVEKTMREQFDNAIQRRHEEAHTAPLADLDQEVAELQVQITPALEAICKWECLVLAGYDTIKRIFHAEFA